LRNWLFTPHNTNHRCGSATLITRLWSGLMVKSGYRFSSVTSIVKAVHPVNHGNRARQHDSISVYRGYQQRDDNGYKTLQEAHPHWPIPQLQLWISAACEMRFSTASLQ
jgi:hypothetical protein